MADLEQLKQKYAPVLAVFQEFAPVQSWVRSTWPANSCI